jgi:prevent-host-death family protein
MKIAPLFEVKNRLSEYVNATASGPVVITKNGKPCAALVHLEADQDMEIFLLSYNQRFLDLLDKAAAKAQSRGGTPLSQVIDEVGKRGKKPRRKESAQ